MFLIIAQNLLINHRLYRNEYLEIEIQILVFNYAS